MKTEESWISIEVEGRPMAAFVARPEGEGPWPGVLLFMEIFGVNEHIRSVARRVAAEGYVVLAPDLFHRGQDRVQLGYDEAGFTRGLELVGQVRSNQLRADVAAAFAALLARPDTTDRIGAMGFCFGGHAAYLAAATQPVAATVSFYGGGIAGPPSGGADRATVELTDGIRGAILCLFGADDSFIPIDQVERIRNAIAESGVRGEVKVYEGVGHGFFCDVRDGYDEAAAVDAWSRLTTLFRDELGT
jgi:carboxymethylenebutenolidase